jgi:prepilin-type processing-associated H-X9-DG protein
MVPLLPYHGNQRGNIRLCPTTKKTQEEGEIVPARMAWKIDIDGQEHRNSYGINNWCYDLRPGVDTIWGMADARRRAWRRIDQHGSVNTPMFLECYRWGGGPTLRSEPAPPDENARYNTGFGRYCLNRHANTINVCFVDGTVRKTPLKELWNLAWHREYDLSRPRPEWPDWLKSLPGD